MTKFILVLFLFLMFSFSPGSHCQAWQDAVGAALPVSRDWQVKDIDPAGEKKRVILVTVDRLKINNLVLPQTPNLKKMTRDGTLGLLNVNTAGGPLPENTYATIGAGAPIKALDTARWGFNADTEYAGGTAGDEYLQRTGQKPPSQGLVHLAIGDIILANRDLPYKNLPGALGKTVHDHQKRTAAFGNSDDIWGGKRQILTLVMDDRGLVDVGSLDEVSVVRPDVPGGIKTDYEKILKLIDALPEDVALVAVDLGDMSRLFNQRKSFFPEILERQRQRVLLETDVFLGELVATLNPREDLLLVFAPTPWADSSEKELMAPILVYGAGVGEGLLVSPSTKRPGIITNTDIAPTVTAFLGMDYPPSFSGRAARVIETSDAGDKLDGMYRQMALTYNARPSLVKGYVFYQLGLLVVSLIFIFGRFKNIMVLKPFLLSVLAVPLVYLLVSLLPQPNSTILATEVVLLTFSLVAASLYGGRRIGMEPFALLSLLVAGGIIIDTFLGSPLQKVSLLGYDAIVGARYYGIGNEYMGVLAGSSIIGASSLAIFFRKSRTYMLMVCALLFMMAFIAIAHPGLGTNAGGTITLAGSFIITLMLLWGVQLNTRTLTLVALSVIFVLLLAVTADAMRPIENQTHLGRAIKGVTEGGINEAGNIIIRKMQMNIKLIKYTIWSRIFLASLAMLALLFFRPVGVMVAIKNKYPELYCGFTGVVIASILAFIFNDSGIVAAATCMIFGAPPLIYLVLKERGWRGSCDGKVNPRQG